MVYTNNVPQSNQQIANTQAPILNNFNFIQAAVNQEHNFPLNSTDSTTTYHKQTSMPNRADPSGALPTGTNGMYYVNGGQAKYYDGTRIYQLTKGTVATNGYQWIGGVLFQWGVTNSSGTGNPNITQLFPITFSTSVFSINCTIKTQLNSRFFVSVYDNTLTTFSATVRDSGGTPITSTQIYWMAVGV